MNCHTPFIAFPPVQIVTSYPHLFHQQTVFLNGQINCFLSFTGSAYVSLNVSDPLPVIPRNQNLNADRNAVSLSLLGYLITNPTSKYYANVVVRRLGMQKCALAGKTCMRCSPFDLNPMIRLFFMAYGHLRIRIFVIHRTNLPLAILSFSSVDVADKVAAYRSIASFRRGPDAHCN